MPTMDPSSKSPPPLWPSLLFAGILAIVLPVVWLKQDDPIGLNLAFAPVFIPLTFALIWPITVALLSPIGGPWLVRHTAATVLFISAITLIVLYKNIEKRHEAEGAALTLKNQRELAVAQSTLSSKGLFAFAEPLNPAESDTLARYVALHPEISADDLLRMSQQYQNAHLMEYVARHKSCPPAALTIIYNTVINQKFSPTFYTFPPDMEGALVQVASNRNTPPETLDKLLHVKRSADVRAAALKNPNLLKSDKIAYEGTLCEMPPTESHSAEEYWFASSDPDITAQILQCFAAEPGWRYFAATSPRASMELLEGLTRPEIDEQTRKAAQENIQKRGTAKQ